VVETIDDGFEATRAGAAPRRATIHGAKGEAWIRVTDEAAAGGKHSLKFQDAPGLSANYDPHVAYTMDAARGAARASFDIRMEKGAVCFHEWRDWSVNPYIIGPSLWIGAEGGLAANGKKLTTIPQGQWMRVSIECPLGEKANGTYRMVVAVSGQSPKAYEGLSCDKRFNHLTWLGFCSMAIESTTFYMDNVTFGAKP
jgi:hypothetical protein